MKELLDFTTLQLSEKALKQHEELWIALKHGDASAAREIASEHLLADVEYQQSLHKG